MSAYTDFVKKHIRTVPGANQKEKMKAVAALWRKHKAGNGLLKGGSVKKLGGKKGMCKVASVADPGIEGGEMMSGGCVQHGSTHRRMQGGSVHPLGAANQIGGGPLGALTSLLGLGVADQPVMEGGNILDTIGGIAKTVGPFVPLAMLAL